MAEAFENKLVIEGIDKIVADLDRLKGESRQAGDGMEKLGDDTKKSGTSLESFATTASHTIDVVKQIYAALSSAASAVVDFAEEFERQAGVINTFSGDITEASSRINGLISDLDLMVAHSKGVHAGLTLTSHELGNVAVAATRMAGAFNIDDKQALDQLMESLVRGTSRGLIPFGIELEGVTGKAAIQQAALAQLEAQYGSLTDEADTLFGKILASETMWENFKTNIIATTLETGELERATNDLEESLGGLSESLGMSTTEFNLAEASADLLVGTIDVVSSKINSLSTIIETNIPMLRSFAAVFAALASGNVVDISSALNTAWERAGTFGGAARNLLSTSVQTGMDIGLAGASVRERREAEQRSSIASGVSRQQSVPLMLQDVAALTSEPPEMLAYVEGTRPPGGSGGGRSDSANNDARELEALMQSILSAHSETVDEMMRQEEIAMQLAEGATQYEALERAKLSLIEQENKALADQVVLQDRGQEKLAKMEKKWGNVSDKIEQGGGMFKDLIIGGIQTAKDEEISFGEAIAARIKKLLEGIAIENLFKGATTLASAIAASVLSPWAAPALYLSAGKHFAIAAATGVSSMAIPGGGGGGGGGEAKPEATTAPAQSQSLGTVVVNFNAPMDEARIGRMQAKANRAANRIYGGVVA